MTISRSRGLYEQEIETRRALGDDRGLAEAQYSISFTWSTLEIRETRYFERAVGAINEALAIFRRIGDHAGVGRCEWALANASYGQGDAEASRRLGRRALAVFEQTDNRFMVGWASYTLALADLTDDYQTPTGRPDALVEAERWLRQALHIFAEADDVSGYTLVLEGFALLAYRNGDRDRAARLSGAVANLERTSGTGLNLWNRSALGFAPDDLRTDPSLAAAWMAGEGMTANEAVAFALDA